MIGRIFFFALMRPNADVAVSQRRKMQQACSGKRRLGMLRTPKGIVVA